MRDFSQRCGVQILEEEEEDARLLDRCEAKMKEWAKHWQCDEEKQNMQNEPWRNEELKECEEALPRLKEDNVSNEALYVIGLHGSGDKISRFLQDWEVAKVALSCQKALDMLCQALYEVERRDVVGLASERACRLSDKPL